VKFGAEEIQELVETSEMVPVEDGQPRARKNSVDSDAASTMAPSSAEPSPMLGCIATDDSTWPSLREATSGFDFCSDASEDEDDDWEDLPAPAVSLDESPPSVAYSRSEAYAHNVEEAEILECKNVNPQMSFADVVRDQSNEDGHVSSPAMKALVPPFRAQPLRRRTSSAPTQLPADDDTDEINEHLFLEQRHGWTKQHKAPWNTRYQRQVSTKTERRGEQRNQTSKSCGEPACVD
jgi:hypothetical protein